MAYAAFALGKRGFMFTQLNPTLPLHVLGKGNGYALGLIDYGQEHHLIWVTALDSGEIWCAPNPEVRMLANWTMGRPVNPLVAAARATRDEPPAELCTDCRTAAAQC